MPGKLLKNYILGEKDQKLNWSQNIFEYWIEESGNPLGSFPPFPVS